MLFDNAYLYSSSTNQMFKILKTGLKTILIFEFCEASTSCSKFNFIFVKNEYAH